MDDRRQRQYVPIPHHSIDYRMAEFIPVVIHAEMPVHAPGVPEPRGLQLWVDLTKQYKMVDPSYQELGPSEYVQLHSLSRLSSSC